ncbi:hypothetical protein C0Q70_07548 [Pomacea canaliculata]|uniref:G-protein coupled receptors family 1 profile domain-containing protein n=1 Tax=Pomacea canaliculata TaxID=400727 RepID=A0A2T7PFD2_POMCA|nr:hypothetical protein C0Q70_07548 [Pomacea canaliculata]
MNWSETTVTDSPYVEPGVDNCSEITDTYSDTLPIVVFISLLLTLSVAGNALLLFIFIFRWRSLGATKVYVCALAILDLLAALLVMPRDLMTMTFRSTRTLGPTFDLNAYCKAVSFFGFACTGPLVSSSSPSPPAVTLRS